jgi:hypothetical protein
LPSVRVTTAVQRDLGESMFMRISYNASYAG